ncbi:MAG: EAL domain-containing response regulator [Cyanobacteria bacterium P01_A01_bin.137]
MTTILVIDDDTDLATRVCDALVFNDFATLRAATGFEGLQLAQGHQPQLIVCDIDLPDITGDALLKQLRSHPVTATIPVIMLAADPGAFRHSMEQGADDCLTKPVDRQSFLRAVQTQITKRAALAQCFASGFEPSYECLTAPVKSDELAKQIAHSKQSPWSRLWVIQLRNYGDLSANYGHVLGQLALQAVGQQLRQWRDRWHAPALWITLAYLGRDRFVVFLRAPKRPAEPDCETARVNLKTTLQHPMVINNHRLILDSRIEVIDPPELTPLRTWENSLAATVSGHNQLSLAERLRRAIQRDELQLYFQPQVDLSSGQIIGAEALVRWCIPGEAQILPIQFISVAEENGLMLPLGEWIVEAALQQLAHWQKKQLSAISMAINLSAHQLRSPHFLNRLMAMVKTVSISPVMIDLELPERLILEDLSQAKLLLAELQSQGFSTAIDDFSSGSLSHLQYLPVNILKLDKCFVRNLHQNRSNRVIVRAIMDIARGLNISTIANGVETARELSILKQLKCHSMQGYLFSPALTAQDFETLLWESSTTHARPGPLQATALPTAIRPL